MNERLIEVRKAHGLSQDAFGKRIGVTASAISRWESGEREIPGSILLLVCRVFGVSETWLRTGAGEMFRPRSREQELGEGIRRILIDRPEGFQAALISTLLKFDPDGPEWAALEKIARALVEGTKKDPEP